MKLLSATRAGGTPSRLCVLGAERLIRHGEVDDSLDQSHDGRDERPAEQQIEDAETWLAEIELVCSEPSEQQGEDRCRDPVPAGPARRPLPNATADADLRPRIDRSSTCATESLGSLGFNDGHAGLLIGRDFASRDPETRGKGEMKGGADVR